MIRFAPLAACSIPALLLAGCAADYGNYPSLARRPAERVKGTAEPAAPTSVPPPAVMPSSDLATRLAQLTSQAEAAHREFTGRRARAEELVGAARGTAVGSENWSVASVALADLETSRSQAMIALADLDELYAAERTAGRDAAAIARTRDRVIDWIGEEDIALAQLRGRMAS